MFPAFLSNEHPKSILKYSAPHPSSGSGDEEDQSEIDSRLNFCRVAHSKVIRKSMQQTERAISAGNMAGLVKIQEEDHEVAFANDTSILFIKSHNLKTSQIAR